MSSYHPGHPPSSSTHLVVAHMLTHKLSHTTGPGGASWRVVGHSAHHENDDGKVQGYGDCQHTSICLDQGGHLMNLMDSNHEPSSVQAAHCSQQQTPQETLKTTAQDTYGRHDTRTARHPPCQHQQQHAANIAQGAPDKSRMSLTSALAPTPPSPLRLKSARLQPAPACLPFSFLQILSVVALVAVFVSAISTFYLRIVGLSYLLPKRAVPARSFLPPQSPHLSRSFPQVPSLV